MPRLSIASVVALTWLVLAAALGAHGGHLHRALGTVAAVQKDQVDVRTNEGKTLRLVLDKKATVTRGKTKLDATALKVGERVSVEYMEEKQALVAHTFKLSTAAPAKK